MVMVYVKDNLVYYEKDGKVYYSGISGHNSWYHFTGRTLKKMMEQYPPDRTLPLKWLKLQGRDV